MLDNGVFLSLRHLDFCLIHEARIRVHLRNYVTGLNWFKENWALKSPGLTSRFAERASTFSGVFGVSIGLGEVDSLNYFQVFVQVLSLEEEAFQ